MSSDARAPAHRLVAVLGTIATVVSCSDGDPVGWGRGGHGGASTGGAVAGGGQASGGEASAGEAGASEAGGGEAGGGTTSHGGTPGAGGGAGRGTSGSSGAGCRQDDDCVPIGECYSASCAGSLCVGSPLARGSACSAGLCNGFARCLACLDEAPGLEVDTGCSADSPMCVETAFEPACVGCEKDADCDDGSECTLDRCAGSVCERAPWPLGRPCAGGVCNGQASADSCVPCLDDASAGPDTGCTTDQPRCDTSTTPATCSACQLPSDCEDDNECTTDGCSVAGCVHATLASGTPCPHGYCNGIPGVELCVPKPCQTDVDCDDRAACTADVCESGSCSYGADHGACPDSGDVCQPNVCTVGTGCQAIDVSRSLELLANGYLESNHVAWTELSANYSQVIYHFDYVPTLLPHTEPYVAWLGGGEGLLDEENSLSQQVRVPVGSVRLELSFFFQIWTEVNLPDDQNHLVVRLRSPEGSPSDEELVTFHNQDATRVWTRFSATIDAAPWSGSDAILEFSGTGIDGFTHFFVDTISLVATVCESP